MRPDHLCVVTHNRTLPYTFELPQQRPVPSFVRVRIKQSKTDPFRRGVDLLVARTLICAPLQRSSLSRGAGPGPLFSFADGRPLTRSRFVARVRVDEGSYCCHILYIGATTTAAARGVEDSVIKTLGRWAYLQYVRIPREQLTGYILGDRTCVGCCLSN